MAIWYYTGGDVAVLTNYWAVSDGSGSHPGSLGSGDYIVGYSGLISASGTDTSMATWIFIGGSQNQASISGSALFIDANNIGGSIGGDAIFFSGTLAAGIIYGNAMLDKSHVGGISTTYVYGDVVAINNSTCTPSPVMEGLNPIIISIDSTVISESVANKFMLKGSSAISLGGPLYLDGTSSYSGGDPTYQGPIPNYTHILNDTGNGSLTLPSTSFVLTGSGTYGINGTGSTPALNVSSTSQINAAIMDETDGIETGWTLREVMRILAALAGGLSSNDGNTIKSISGSKPRITGTVDGNGNRTSVILDKTP